MSQLDLNKEIVFASSDTDVSHAISRLVKQGKLLPHGQREPQGD